MIAFCLIIKIRRKKLRTKKFRETYGSLYSDFRFGRLRQYSNMIIILRRVICIIGLVIFYESTFIQMVVFAGSTFIVKIKK